MKTMLKYAVLPLVLAAATLEAQQTVSVPITVTVTKPTATAVGKAVVATGASSQIVAIPAIGAPPPTCAGARPPTTVASQQCPAGTGPGVWPQTTTYACVGSVWTPAVTPASAPASACPPIVAPPPTGSCGLPAPAFCDTFSSPSAVRGRAGDLNPALWGVGRLSGEISSSGIGTANPSLAAPIPACRATFTQTTVYPPNDTLVCDAGTLMTAVSIQNYGNNSYMVRQPFDFAGRTGKIEFDVDAVSQGLGGYPEVDITEDPVPAPNFREFNNFEAGGSTPKNGLIIKFTGSCPGTSDVYPLNTMVYVNYVGTIVKPTFDHANGCVKTSRGSLNHFEIQLSQTQVSVYGSDFSTDGKTFANYKLLYTASISLPFTRGYVHVDARNHASLKYGLGQDAVFHWDNVGFDGPAIAAPKAYEVPDNFTTLNYSVSGLPAVPAVNLGYLLFNGTTGKPAGMYSPTVKIPTLTLRGVDLVGAKSATLTFSAFFNGGPHLPDTTWGVSYRFNGGAVRAVNLTAVQIAGMSNNAGGYVQAVTAFVAPVPLADLVQGVNTVEFLPLNAPMDYPPVIANIDLLLN